MLQIFFLTVLKVSQYFYLRCSWASRNNGCFSAFCTLEWEHVISVQTFCYLSPCTAQPGDAGHIPRVPSADTHHQHTSDSSLRNHRKGVYTHTHACTAACCFVLRQLQSCAHTQTEGAPEPSQSCQRSVLSQKGNASSPRAERTAPCQRAEAVPLHRG